MFQLDPEKYQAWLDILLELEDLRARKRWLTWYNPNFQKELLGVETETGHQLSREHGPPESVLRWEHVKPLKSTHPGGRFLTKWELTPFIGDNLWELVKLRTQAKKEGWGLDKKEFPRDQLWYRLRNHKQPPLSYHEIANIAIRDYPVTVDQYVIRWLEKTQPHFLNCVDPKRKVRNSEKTPFSYRANTLLYKLGILKIAISTANYGWPAFEQWPPVKISASEELLKGQEYYVRYDFNCNAWNSAFKDKSGELDLLKRRQELREKFLEERGIYIGEGKELSDFEQLIKQAIRRMEKTIRSIEPLV